MAATTKGERDERAWSWWQRPWLWAAVAAFALGLLTWGNGFVIDDHYLIENNAALRELRQVPRFFISAWGNDGGGAARTQINAAYYRPLSSSLQALQVTAFQRQGQLRPAGFHGVSTVLYALAAALVALLIERLGRVAGLTRPKRAALLGGLLFAVHPVHTEALAAATYQTTLLAGLLAAAALLAAAGSLQGAAAQTRRGLAKRAVLVGMLSLAAVLAKEEAAALPALVLLLGVAAPPGDGPRRALWLALASTTGVLLMLAVRSTVVHSAGITYFAGAPPGATLWTMMRVYGLYAQLLVLPWHLCPFYDWFILPIEIEPTLPVLAGVVTLLGTLALVLGMRRRRPLVALGLLWVLAGLLPVAHLLPMLNVAAERFLYLPSIGLCLAAAAWASEAGRPRLSIALAAAVLLLFAVRSGLRLRDWRSDETLNLATSRDFPETPMAPYNLFRIYRDAGDLPRAHAALREAARRAPELPMFQQELRAFEAEHPGLGRAGQP